MDLPRSSPGTSPSRPSIPPRAARALHPTVEFAVADAWDGAALRRAWRAGGGSSGSGGGGDANALGGGGDDRAGSAAAVAAAGTAAEAAGPAILCVDVGGLSSSHGELDTLALLQVTFSRCPRSCALSRQCLDPPPSQSLGGTFDGAGAVRAIVAKSHCLRALARTLTPADSRPHQQRQPGSTR